MAIGIHCLMLLNPDAMRCMGELAMKLSKYDRTMSFNTHTGYVIYKKALISSITTSHKFRLFYCNPLRNKWILIEKDENSVRIIRIQAFDSIMLCFFRTVTNSPGADDDLTLFAANCVEHRRYDAKLPDFEITFIVEKLKSESNLRFTEDYSIIGDDRRMFFLMFVLQVRKFFLCDQL